MYHILWVDFFPNNLESISFEKILRSCHYFEIYISKVKAFKTCYHWVFFGPATKTLLVAFFASIVFKSWNLIMTKESVNTTHNLAMLFSGPMRQSWGMASECILKMCINAGEEGLPGVVTMPSVWYLCSPHLQTHTPPQAPPINYAIWKAKACPWQNEKSKSICGSFSIRCEGSWHAWGVGDSGLGDGAGLVRGSGFHAQGMVVGCRDRRLRSRTPGLRRRLHCTMQTRTATTHFFHFVLLTKRGLLTADFHWIFFVQGEPLWSPLSSPLDSESWLRQRLRQRLRIRIRVRLGPGSVSEVCAKG